MLKQVLLNLLSNAVKFTPEGGQVSLSVLATEKDGVSICICDTGIGMSPEDVIRIGQPFVQIDNKLARKYEGSGLGLAIAKRLVELHGGDLTVESKLEKGTTVTVRLPPSRFHSTGTRAVEPDGLSEHHASVGTCLSARQ